MNYALHILIVCEIYIILSLAMNLLAGYSGLLSFTQAGFYGIGAYTTAMFLVKLKLTFFLSLFGAVIITAISCLPVIWFSIRLRNLFFSLATLSWQIIVYTILYNFTSFTNGPFGMAGIPKPVIFGYQFNSLLSFSLLGGFLTILVLTFFILFHQTPLSRLIQGVRDDQLAMMTFGKSPAKYKSLAILVSSSVSAIAGCLFATYFSYIDPTSFTLDESILIFSIVLIGGLGTIKGSVAGALFYVLLPEALRFLNLPDAVAANFRMMLYALILIIMVIFRPYGFFGKYKFEQ